MRRAAAPILLASLLIPAAALPRASATEVQADFSAYRPDSGVAVRQDGTRLHVRWPIAEGEHGVLVLQLRPTEPLIEEIGIAPTGDGPSAPLLRKVNPVTLLTVGVRDLSKQGWNAFFDNPPRRPHETFPAVLAVQAVRVQSQGRRSTVVLDGLSAGPFRGDLRFTVYPGCRLVHVAGRPQHRQRRLRHPVRRRTDPPRAGLEDGRLARHPRPAATGCGHHGEGGGAGRRPPPGHRRRGCQRLGRGLPAAAPVPLPA